MKHLIDCENKYTVRICASRLIRGALGSSVFDYTTFSRLFNSFARSFSLKFTNCIEKRQNPL